MRWRMSIWEGSVPRNLIIAYVAVWVIHAGYLGYVVRRFARLKSRSDR